MEQNLLFENSAIQRVLKTLKELKGYKWKHIHPTNKGRYAIVTGEPNIAIHFKRDTFHNFGYKFRKQGQHGVGDSINCEHLKEFIQEGVKTIYTMFPTGDFYSIDIQEFLQNSFKWMQKEGTEVRSISIHKYRVVKQDGKQNKKT